MAEKPHLNLVFIGHVDHGKSTSVGRLLMETGHIEPYLIEKYRKLAEEKGKATFEFAWVMDSLKEERERGVTIDVSIRSSLRQVLLHHHRRPRSPGLRQEHDHWYLAGRCGRLVVSAVEGPQAQTKEHIFLARTLGVTQVIVAINKIDATKPAYDQKRYDEVKEEVSKLLKGVGYKMEKVQIIPLSPTRATTPSSHPRTCHGTRARPCSSRWTCSRSRPRRPT